MLFSSQPELAPLSTDRENGFVAYLGKQVHTNEQKQEQSNGPKFVLHKQWVDGKRLIKLWVIPVVPVALFRFSDTKSPALWQSLSLTVLCQKPAGLRRS